MTGCEPHHKQQASWRRGEGLFFRRSLLHRQCDGTWCKMKLSRWLGKVDPAMIVQKRLPWQAGGTGFRSHICSKVCRSASCESLQVRKNQLRQRFLSQKASRHVVLAGLLTCPCGTETVVALPRFGDDEAVGLLRKRLLHRGADGTPHPNSCSLRPSSRRAKLLPSSPHGCDDVPQLLRATV